MASHLETVKSFFYELPRILVPPYDERIPVTPYNALMLLVLTFPFFFMAYLTRRPHTYTQRLLLLPIVILCNFRLGFWYYFPNQTTFSVGLACACQALSCKALDYALRPKGMLKVGETIPGALENQEITDSPGRSIPKWLVDIVELVHEQRGIGWQFGVETYTPPETRPLDRPTFLKISFYHLLTNFLMVDTLDTIIKQIPGVGTQEGGSIFFPHLPPLQRYTVSTIIHFLTGCRFLAQFALAFYATSVVAIGLFNAEPRDWPPIQEQPGKSQSMHELWGKRWHQMLRQLFMVYGGYPGYWIGGNLGMALGTFLGSGLYHELAMYALGRGWEWHSFIFFAMQGPILMFERVWRRVTGRRIGGRLGQLWVYLIIFGGGQMMIDSWGRRGLSGGIFVPPFCSPWQLWFLPWLSPWMSKYVTPLISDYLSPKP